MNLNYENEFKGACKRSLEWKLEIPDVFYSSEPVLSGINRENCIKVIQEVSSRYTADEISQQCFWYMLNLKPMLEDVLDSPLYYTLGYIQFQYNKKTVFYTSENELRGKLSDGVVPGTAFNLHAWLTTTHMEIIDLTFGTTYGVVHNIPELIGLCTFKHSSEFDENMVYHPQLIGDDYLKKIGALVEISALHF